MSAPKGNKNARNKRSHRAKDAALAVIENMRKGTGKSLYKILVEKGYSKWVAEHPQKVLGTKSAQEVLHPMITAAEEVRALAISGIIEQKKYLHKLPITDLALVSNRMTTNIDSMGGNKPADEKENEELRKQATSIAYALKALGVVS